MPTLCAIFTARLIRRAKDQYHDGQMGYWEI